MSIEKISKRAMYEGLIETMKTGVCPFDPEQVVAFCEHEIELIDHKNAKAKERSAAKAKEGDALQAALYEILTDEFEPIADIVARLDDPDATVSKVAYRLSKLAEAGKAEKGEVTVVATEGAKARKVVAYRVIAE